MLGAAVDAVEPSHLLQSAYHRSPLSRRTRAVGTPDLLIVAAGKAAWPMARAFAELETDAVRRGVIAGPLVSSTGAGSRSLPHQFESFDASHPFPNEASVAAGLRALELARESRARPDGSWSSALGRGVGAPGRARAWHHARGQDGHRACAHARRRGHRWTQLRPQAPVARSRVAGSPRPRRGR